jgi:hypothetical protein
MNEAKNGNITLYSAVNDRFTTKLSYADLTANINQLPLTRTVKDPFGSTYHECISAELLNKAIVKFKIKEDWLQTKDSKKVIVRILGIAPVVLITNTNGTTPILGILPRQQGHTEPAHRTFSKFKLGFIL